MKKIIKTEKAKIFFAYTLFFMILSLIIFRWKIFSDKTFVDSGDSLSQHFKAFVYYGRYLRQILSNVFIHHNFLIPQFDFTIGEGSDIFQTLCYYCIGDPFALLSIFASEKNAYIAYDFSIFFRFFCAGFAFCYLCSYFEKKNLLAILTGVACYVFVPATLQMKGQIFFINPFIFFPFLIVGVNKILKNEKPFLYIFTVFFAVLSNLYFFYMLALILIVYTLVKCVFIEKLRGKILLILATKCFFYAVFALILAAFLLFPVIYFYANDTRSSVSSLQFLYDIKTYIKLPLSFTWKMPVQSFFAIFALFFAKSKVLSKKDLKETKSLCIFLVICLAFLFLPFLSQILNAFSYPSDRWSFALILLLSYIVVVCFDELLSFSFVKGLSIIALWCAYCFFTSIFMDNNGYRPYAIKAGLLAVVFLLFSNDFFVLKKIIPRLAKKIACSFMIIFSIILLNGAEETLTKLESTDFLFNNSGEKIKNISESPENEFFRFSKTGINKNNDDVNTSMISKVSGTEYYWSLMNSDVLKFRKSLEIADQRHDFWYSGYDSRPILMKLANVLYFSKYENQVLTNMYDFEKTSDDLILKNQDFLPFGYTFDTYLLKSDFEKFNGAEKEAILAKAIVLEDDFANLKKLQELKTGVEEIDFEAEYSESEIMFSKTKISAKDDNVTLKLKFQPQIDKNIYLRFVDGDFYKPNGQNPKWVTFSITTNTGYTKKIDLELSGYLYYNGVLTNTVNLGFSNEENSISEISIEFSDEGNYLFSDFALYSLPTPELSSEIHKLSDETLGSVPKGMLVLSRLDANNFFSHTKSSKGLKPLVKPLFPERQGRDKIASPKTHCIGDNWSYLSSSL